MSGEARGRGRPRILSDRDKSEILRRLAQGDTPALRREICKEFKISRSRFYELFSGKAQKVREVATRLADVEREVESLPISEMISVRTLADQMKALGQSLVNTAVLNGETAQILASRAARAAKELPQSATVEDLRLPGAYLEVTNKATSLGVTLLAANREPIGERSLEDLIEEVNRRQGKEDSLAEAIRKGRMRVATLGELLGETKRQEARGQTVRQDQTVETNSDE